MNYCAKFLRCETWRAMFPDPLRLQQEDAEVKEGSAANGLHGGDFSAGGAPQVSDLIERDISAAPDIPLSSSEMSTTNHWTETRII